MNLPRSTLGGPMRCRPCAVGSDPVDPAVVQASLEAGTQVLTATNTLLQAHANRTAARQQTAHRRKRKKVAPLPPPPPPPRRARSWLPLAVLGGLAVLAVALRKPKKAVP